MHAEIFFPWIRMLYLDVKWLQKKMCYGILLLDFNIGQIRWPLVRSIIFHSEPDNVINDNPANITDGMRSWLRGKSLPQEKAKVCVQFTRTQILFICRGSAREKQISAGIYIQYFEYSNY